MYTSSRLRATLLYLLMVAGSVLGFLLIRQIGNQLPVPEMTAAVSNKSPTAPPVDVLPHILLALFVVALCGWLAGRLCQLIGQPPVIGEVLAGIMLGPSLLGWLAPAVLQFLLPPLVAPHLGMLAQLGVILYLFLVGLELDTAALAKRGHAALAISHASIVVPFLCGAMLALVLYQHFAPPGVPFTIFALFLGVAMSITAFPVLARILTDRKMSRTPLGVLALTCAAVDDVTAWCLLALLVGVARADVGGALWVVGLSLGYFGLMVFVVRPLLVRFSHFGRGESLSRGTITLVLLAVVASALATEWIGIHALFGAFLLGAIIPHESAIARQMTAKLEDVVTILLLPAFFAYTGLRTQIGLVSGVEQWLVGGLIIAVATFGKFGGTLIVARLTGSSWRDAAALGTLMNTRGLMELVVLNIGLDLGVISPTLFAMMVLMALVTTMATAPVLALLVPSERMLPAEERLDTQVVPV